MKGLLVVFIMTIVIAVAKAADPGPAINREPPPPPPQFQPHYVPPDLDLWTQMTQAFNELPISLNAHQQIMQIMQQVQQQAMARERQKAAASAQPPATAPTSLPTPRIPDKK
jgi:hypothetical protein